MFQLDIVSAQEKVISWQCRNIFLCASVCVDSCSIHNTKLAGVRLPNHRSKTQSARLMDTLLQILTWPLCHIGARSPTILCRLQMDLWPIYHRLRPNPWLPSTWFHDSHPILLHIMLHSSSPLCNINSDLLSVLWSRSKAVWAAHHSQRLYFTSRCHIRRNRRHRIRCDW